MSIFSSRREFLKSLGLAAGTGCGRERFHGTGPGYSLGRVSLEHWCSGVSCPSGSVYMGGCRLRSERVRIAFIGVGGRGFSHLAQMCVMDGVEITGVCDLKRDLTERGVDRVRKKTGKKPAGYSGGEMEYLTMLRELKPDAVIISTDWSSHARIASDSMPERSARLCGSAHGRFPGRALEDRGYQ